MFLSNSQCICAVVEGWVGLDRIPQCQHRARPAQLRHRAGRPVGAGVQSEVLCCALCCAALLTRLSPHSTTARPACLRLRLLGCPYSGNFFSSLLSALTGPGGSSRLSGAAAPHLHPAAGATAGLLALLLLGLVAGLAVRRYRARQPAPPAATSQYSSGASGGSALSGSDLSLSMFSTEESRAATPAPVRAARPS